jgi:adenine phosphoribosyltransferase
LRESFTWTGEHADFADVLRDSTFLDVVGTALADAFRDQAVSAVIGVEARGFVFGALAARSLDVGLVLARKPGSVHPDAVSEAASEPDWRGRMTEVRISRRAVRPGDRLLLVDDWIETGSQARTVRSLVERLGSRFVGVSAVVDDTDGIVRRTLNVRSIVRSSELRAGA